jgi:cytidine deaminase
MDDKTLFKLAWDVRRKAHAPYSRFRVGAILLGKSGKAYPGCNVENASYGLTICAERNALAHAVAQGEKAFRKLILVAETGDPILPCGACCQVLAEFGSNLEVLSANRKGRLVRASLFELLPKAFRLRQKKK